MIAKFGIVLDRESWGVHIIDAMSPTVSIHRKGKSSPTLKNNLAERGLVISDKIADKQVFLPAVGALYILTDMREVDTWGFNGMVIEVPALTSAPRDEKVVDEEILHTPFIRQNPEYVLSNPLRLTLEQSKDLFGILSKNEELLREIEKKDAVIARQQVTDLFAKIAEFGRRKRLSQDDSH